MTDLTNVVNTTARVMFIKQASNVPRVKEIHNRICLLPALFTDSFMMKIISRSILATAWKEWNEKRDTQTLTSLKRVAIDLFSLTFFSRQPSENTKEKFASATGQKFSKFRNGILFMSFMVMQKNSFSTFRNDPKVLQTARVRNGANGEPCESLFHIFQPYWLQSGFVPAEHCSAAAAKFEKRSLGGDLDAVHSVADSEATKFNEDRGTDVKIKQAKVGSITGEEIAVEASSLVYKIITSVLRRSRFAGKADLFRSVFYLFTGCAQFDAPVRLDNLKLKWDDSLWP